MWRKSEGGMEEQNEVDEEESIRFFYDEAWKEEDRS
jgi:hypothetical protein